MLFKINLGEVSAISPNLYVTHFNFTFISYQNSILSYLVIYVTFSFWMYVKIKNEAGMVFFWIEVGGFFLLLTLTLKKNSCSTPFQYYL